jgi:hypothetical protein
MKARLHIHSILPIYDARLQLVVADDLISERRKQEHLFGPVPGESFNALCSYSRGHNFALFFEPSALTHRIIGHEVWHLTKRICEWSGVGISNDESGALLCGWLHWWVYKHAGKMVRPDLKP